MKRRRALRINRISQERTEITGQFSGTWVSKYELHSAPSGDWVYTFDPPILFTLTHEKEMRTTDISASGNYTQRSFDKWYIECTLPNGEAYKGARRSEEDEALESLCFRVTDGANQAFRYNRPHPLVGKSTRAKYQPEARD